MNNTATREELKAILDEWIPKYIRQVVELRSGSRLSAERYNELMNLLITQGDDTIELAETVKQYMELLVEDMSAEFEVTTALANTAVSTANNAVTTINQYKTTIDNDIAAFKATITQATDTANSNANLALQTANQLVADMSAYQNELTQDINDTFDAIRADLGTQVTDEVLTQMQGIQEALTADINNTINALSEDVMTIANTAEQAVNSAVQDIEAYKADMDVRLDAALKEVEDSLSVAGDIIQDASAIYEAINGMQETVDGFEDRLGAVEEFVENADFASSEHTHTASQVGLGNVPNVATNDQTPTFTIASSNAELTSGEKLSVAFGKIAKAIKSFIAHLADTTSHITSTERTTWNSKANASHGNHVPTTQTASNKVFLRNDNTWQTVTPANIGAAASSHTHTKAQITDFPTSLPASDVYAWAKASAKPSYSWSEITSKPTSFTPAAHNQGANTITAGTFAGQVAAPAGTDYTTARMRNGVFTTSDPGAGASVSYVNGTSIDVYE